ncbi:TPA: host cell division inhibitor Icd-like protein [Escherichia coli]|nr:host cell division inhibitor Icd-like protein [Escherichia coli]
MAYTVFNLNTAVGGGQGYQSGERLLVAFRRLGHFAKKSSMANLSGLEDKKGFVFSTLDNSASSRSMVFSCFCRMISSSCVCVSCFGDSVLLVMVLPCKAMRRSTSHHGADSFYPLGSMPRRFSSVRPNSLSQLARLTPSLLASLSNCSLSSGAIRIWNGGAFPAPFGFLSRLIIVDMCTPIRLCFHSIGVHLNTRAPKKAKPEGARNTNGLLTTNDNESIEVAMRNHTQTRPEFIYTFTALHRDRMADGATTVHVAADTLVDARQMVKEMGYVAAFWKGRKENRLIATGKNGYDSRAPHKTGAGIATPQTIEAIQTPYASFFVSAHTHTSTMVGCTGPTLVGLGSSIASCSNPVQSTASELATSGGGYIPSIEEAATMATVPALAHSQTVFIWRFMQCHEKQTSLFTVTAATEREARAQLPHAHLIFVARIRQGVNHVQ